jgi:hypothetical protein
VIPLPVILAAEVLIEESPQRPEIFATKLTAHFDPRPSFDAVFIIKETPVIFLEKR